MSLQGVYIMEENGKQIQDQIYIDDVVNFAVKLYIKSIC